MIRVVVGSVVRLVVVGGVAIGSVVGVSVVGVSVVGVSVVAGAGCSGRPTFGAVCKDGSECAAGEMCLAGVDRCVPSRQKGEVGEQCGDAVELVPEHVLGTKGGDLLRWRGTTAAGGAVNDDDASSCAGDGRADLFFGFTVPPGEVIAIDAHVDAPSARAAISLREGACVEVNEACAGDGGTGSEHLVVPFVEPGDYVLAVDINDAAAGTRDERGFAVVVDQVECPRDFVPDGDGCFGFVPLAGVDVIRTHMAATAIAGDRVVISGGLSPGSNGAGESRALLFDRPALTWTQIGMAYPRRDHTSAALDNGTVLLYGGSDDLELDFGEALFPGEDRFVRGLAGYVPSSTLRGASMVALRPHRGLLLVGDGVPSIGSFAYEDQIGFACDVVLCEVPGLECVVVEEDFGEQGAVCSCVSRFCTGETELPVWQDTGGHDGTTPDDLRNREGSLLLSFDNALGPVAALDIGGHNEFGPAGPELYQQAIDTWSPTGSDGDRLLRDDMQGAFVKRRAVMVGGRNLGAEDHGAVSAEVDVYDPATNFYEPRASLASPRIGHMVAPIGKSAGGLDSVVGAVGDLIVVGGAGEDGVPLATSELIDVDAGGDGTGARVRPGPSLPFGVKKGVLVALSTGEALLAGGSTVVDDEGNDATSVAFLLTHIAHTRSVVPIVTSGGLSISDDAKNDVCEDATVLEGLRGSVVGSTNGADDDIDARETDDCTLFPSPGGDVFFKLHMPADSHGNLTLAPISADLGLYIVDACPPDSHCVIGKDDGFSAEEENVQFENVDERDVFVVVDSEFAGSGDVFTLTWTISTSTP